MGDETLNPLASPVAAVTTDIEELHSLDEAGDDKPEKEVNLEAALLNKASSFSCYTCLTNTIMGGGILGLPYAFAGTGWLVGTILMILCACSSVFSLHELSICASKTEKPSSFYSVAMKGMSLVTGLLMCMCSRVLSVVCLCCCSLSIASVADRRGGRHQVLWCRHFVLNHHWRAYA